MGPPGIPELWDVAQGHSHLASLADGGPSPVLTSGAPSRPHGEEDHCLSDRALTSACGFGAVSLLPCSAVGAEKGSESPSYVQFEISFMLKEPAHVKQTCGAVWEPSCGSWAETILVKPWLNGGAAPLPTGKPGTPGASRPPAPTSRRNTVAE